MIQNLVDIVDFIKENEKDLLENLDSDCCPVDKIEDIDIKAGTAVLRMSVVDRFNFLLKEYLINFQNSEALAVKKYAEHLKKTQKEKINETINS